MIEINKRNIIIFSLVFILCFFSGVFFSKIYQPNEKTMQVYSHALRDYNKGDYSNSYYLFSRVGFLSNLKPVAIYRQALCAKELGDNKTAVKQLKFFLKFYPRHKLNIRVMYTAAQLLTETDPNLARKYFDHIIEHHPHTDFAIASEYYLGVLLMNEYKNKDIFPQSDKVQAENAFRHYLKQAPAGRLALQAVKNWLSLGTEINKDDYLLMAKSYYLFNDYPKALELLNKCDFADSWALDVKNSFALDNLPRAKYLTEYGVQRYSANVDEKDFIDAVNIYLQIVPSKTDGINKLLSLENGQKNTDYILSVKCDSSSLNEKAACYNNLYVKYKNGPYASDALSQIFLAKIRHGKTDDAKKIGKDYLLRFSKSSNAPMVMYWMGKLYQKSNSYAEYSNYYKNIISKYPDNYYAYRAYLKLNNYHTPLIGSYLENKPVEYPYKRLPKKDVILKLVELKDFDMLNELCDDDFVKAWVLYKKGNYSQSMLIARDAMDKLDAKPDKYDLRWRLVYPVNYYESVKNYSSKAGNNLPLIMSIIREESYFNPSAKSSVGALGLMQVMPQTAGEVSNVYNLGINPYLDLFNPDLNIEVGNYYYAQLKSMLNGQDVSSIAAYNGGIGSVSRWKSSLYYNDTDDFVEQIPYNETKNYVKKVFRSYWNYLRIYTGNK